MSVTALALLKAHSNITGTTDDVLLQHYLDVAEDWIGEHLGVPFGGPRIAYASVAQAALMLAAHLYEQREAVTFERSGSAVPFGVETLLSPYRENVTGYVPE